MTQILLVGEDPGTFREFAGYLYGRTGMKVMEVFTAQEALDLLMREKIDAVVVDESLDGGKGMAVARALPRINPLINCAVISSRPHADFHETTEGLGVFMQLPVAPKAEHAAKMLELLAAINIMMTM